MLRKYSLGELIIQYLQVYLFTCLFWFSNSEGYNFVIYDTYYLFINLVNWVNELNSCMESTYVKHFDSIHVITTSNSNS